MEASSKWQHHTMGVSFLQISNLQPPCLLLVLRAPSLLAISFGPLINVEFSNHRLFKAAMPTDWTVGGVRIRFYLSLTQPPYLPSFHLYSNLPPQTSHLTDLLHHRFGSLDSCFLVSPSEVPLNLRLHLFDLFLESHEHDSRSPNHSSS